MTHSIDCGLVPQARRWAGPVATAAASVSPKIAFAILILFLLVLYSNVAIAYPQLAELRPALVVGMASLFMLIVELAKTRQSFRLSMPQGILLIAFLGACFVSSFAAFWPRYAFEKTADVAKIVVIYIVIENTVTSVGQFRTILTTMVLGGLFPAIGTLHHYAYGILRQGRATWIGVFANANEDAYSLVILIPIALALAVESGWWMRLVFGGIIATYLVAIFVTYSRGGLLGLLAVLAFAGWKQKSLMLRGLMMAGFAALPVVVGMYWQRGEGFSDIRRDTTVNQRIATMRAGIRMFEANPLLGIGPACSLFAYPIYVPPEDHCGCEQQLVVHNTFVQVLSEVGILGFIPFMSFLGISLLQVRQMQKGVLGTYNAAIEVALWGFMVCSLSGGFTYTWWPYILIALAMTAKQISPSGVFEH